MSGQTSEAQFKLDKRFKKDIVNSANGANDGNGKSFEDAVKEAAADPNPLDRLVKTLFDKLNDMELKGRLSRNEVINCRRMLNYGKRYGQWFCIEQVYEHLRLSVSYEGKGREEGVAMARASAEQVAAQMKANERRI